VKIHLAKTLSKHFNVNRKYLSVDKEQAKYIFLFCRDLATVITNLFSAIPWIGVDLVNLIWGGFSVDNATLNRFFSLHYLLPFILLALVVMHLIALHDYGSNNPEGINSNSDKIRFHPYFTSKDLVGFIWFAIFISIFIYWAPNYLGQWMAVSICINCYYNYTICWELFHNDLTQNISL
jgi:quinol-cytochrome oxidoreductase complex cytochrome b subunit